MVVVMEAEDLVVVAGPVAMEAEDLDSQFQGTEPGSDWQGPKVVQLHQGRCDLSAQHQQLELAVEEYLPRSFSKLQLD